MDNQNHAARILELAAEKNVEVLVNLSLSSDEIDMHSANPGTLSAVIDADQPFLMEYEGEGALSFADPEAAIDWLLEQTEVRHAPDVPDAIEHAETKATERRVRSGNVPIAKIDTSKSIREIDQAHVKVLAASIVARGLLSPILLSGDPNVTPDDHEGKYDLVNGHHRLLACQSLGMENVPAIIRHYEDDNQLINAAVDSNVLAKLNKLDRANHIALAAHEYVRKHGKQHGGDRRSSEAQNQAVKFTTWLKERFGIEERACQRALKIARLSEQTQGQLFETPIADNEGKLYALANLPAGEQEKVAKQWKDNPRLTIQDAQIAAGVVQRLDPTPSQAKVQQMVAIWRHMDKSERLSFYEGVKGDIHNLLKEQIK